MLIQANACREGKVRADSHEHPAPASVVQVEIVLLDPALLQLQMPAVFLLVADGDQDAGRFTGLQDDDHLIGLGSPEVRLDEFIPPSVRRGQHRCTPLLGTVLHPVVILAGNIPQNIPADGIELAVVPKEPHHSFWLLEGLNETVQENAVQTAIVKPYAILMVLVEGVHRILQDVRSLEG
ncbi:MAG: hypothetical protein ACE5MK_04870 [Acidobacteriota bacterium]